MVPIDLHKETFVIFIVFPDNFSIIEHGFDLTFDKIFPDFVSIISGQHILLFEKKFINFRYFLTLISVISSKIVIMYLPLDVFKK